MDYNSTRSFTMTLAHRAVGDIRRGGFRQLRNYVDMCATLAKKQQQKDFFAYAQKALQRTDSCYYSLIHRLLDSVDEDRICTVGVNMGFGGLIYGASELKKQADLEGQPIAWITAARCGDERLSELVPKAARHGSFVWLPIDSKFPGDTYGALRDAYEEGSREQIDACVKQLIATLKSEAKDIHDKYLAPPHTTEFGIMFLPFEGLYAEAVSRGMVEILQRDYHVNLAGPSTMAALLNSLQMSFRTIAIQKRSGEVWSVLGAVKTEFDKFEACLTQTQNRLDQASRELDKLVGTRTRAIRRKLKGVTELSEAETQKVLDIGTDSEEE